MRRPSEGGWRTNEAIDWHLAALGEAQRYWANHPIQGIDRLRFQAGDLPFRSFKASRLLIEAGFFTTVDDGNHRVRCSMGTDGHGQPFDAIAQPTA
jgi:hypothetical protein